MRSGRIIGTAITGLLLAVVLGCTQKDDGLLKPSSTLVKMEISKLPTAPPGMFYQLWACTRPAIDTSAPASVVKPLLRFNYLYLPGGPALVDSASNPISTDQTFPIDIYDYASVLVSVEQVAGGTPVRPANVMMTTPITTIPDQIYSLRVPGSDDLTSSLLRFNMEAISDNDRNQNDGCGIWLSSYLGRTDTIPDTTAITNVTYTTITMLPVIVGGDTVNLKELKAVYPDSVVNIHPETTYYDFGPDSLISGVSRFRHVGMRFNYTFRADSTYPYTKHVNVLTFQTNGTPVSQFTRFMETFTQDDFRLPNLSRFGFKWKAWVLAPASVLPDGGLGSFTPPAWPTSGSGFTWIAPVSGRLLPFAVFGNIATNDEDGNPFTNRLFRGYTCPTCTDSTYKIPRLPGEDFLNNTALQAAHPGLTAPLNLMPLSTGNSGTVIVSLEPSFHLSSATNFPLIAHFGLLPSGRNAIAGITYQIQMSNGTSTTAGNPAGPGFPVIKFSVTRI